MELTPQRLALGLAKYLWRAAQLQDDAAVVVSIRKAFAVGGEAVPDLGVWGPDHKPRKRAWKGLGIDIENPRGSRREGVGSDGKPWSTLMLCDYGYIRKTEGADGDDVDVFLGPNPDKAEQVYVVRQRDEKRGFAAFDEDKCMIGFDNDLDAKRAYEAHYDKGDFFGGMDAYPVGSFVQYVKDHHKAPPRSAGTLESAAETFEQLRQKVLANFHPAPGSATMPAGGPENG